MQVDGFAPGFQHQLFLRRPPNHVAIKRRRFVKLAALNVQPRQRHIGPKQPRVALHRSLVGRHRARHFVASFEDFPQRQLAARIGNRLFGIANRIAIAVALHRQIGKLGVQLTLAVGQKRRGLFEHSYRFFQLALRFEHLTKR